MDCLSPTTTYWHARIFLILLVFVSSTGCNSHTTPAEGDVHPAAPDTPLQSEATPIPVVPRPTSRPPPPPVPSPDPGRETPIATPTMPSTPPPESVDEVPPVGGEHQSEAEPNSFRIPVLDDSYLTTSEAAGEPFDRNGPMPERIIASTDKCQIVSIDARTGEVASIWNYPNVRIEDLYDDTPPRLNAGEEEPSPEPETPCDWIHDLEWIDPSFILLSICCEPAVGRFEVIDTSLNNQPYWVALDGTSPSVNGDDVLAFSRAHPLGEVEPYAVGSTPFDVRFDDESDPDYPFFSLQSDNTYYSLSFSSEQGSGVLGSVSQVSWVGNHKIAFVLWTEGLYPEFYPFMGIMDIESQSVVFKSRGNGWVMPTGDADGNLVVVELHCFSTPGTCDTQDPKIVVLDPDTLTPVYEVSVSERVFDIDLSRGWLLVTFSNGQTGTFDLADGTFTAIADGIVNAGWME